MKRLSINRLAWIGLGCALLMTGCDQQMENQPRYEPYEAAPGWDNNQSAREPVAGTVARGENLEPTPSTLPMPLTRALLEDGKRHYEIHCTPCHGRVGYGDGMVVQRGFPAPPSFHSVHFRNAPLRHIFDAITDGSGVMYSYRARVAPNERWAIAAYIRALQLSQNGRVEDLTEEQRNSLDKENKGTPDTGEGNQ